LYNRYTTTVGELYEELDGDIDSPDEWKQIYRPLRDCVEDSLRELEKENPCKEGETMDPNTKKCIPIPKPDPDQQCPEGQVKDSKGNCVTKKKTTNWTICTSPGPYRRGCKDSTNDGPIHKAQKCLGITSDGLFGGQTERSVNAKLGKKEFNDQDLPTICGGKADEDKKDENKPNVDNSQEVDVNANDV
jgi:hypothetical protein